tara:strand:- start:1399 stop:2046 length:648 start_codon:yes stop_codon:yes gene_type:complete
MTYLEAINNVLRRLREDEVSTTQETSYSGLIGDLVNDAKKLVEDSWTWSALRSTIQVATVIDQAEYSLTGSGQSAVIKQAMSGIGYGFLTLNTVPYFDNLYFNQTPASAAPTDYIVSGIDDNDDLKVKVYPQPDAVYTLRFDIAAPQAILASDATKIKVPYHPVVQMAYAMALRERGETGGQSAAEQFAVASSALSDAIAVDANRYPLETTYMVV